MYVFVDNRCEILYLIREQSLMELSVNGEIETGIKLCAV
jgi:hypothetical protein